MNNNQINFDPMTGQKISNNTIITNQQAIPTQSQIPVQPSNPTPTTEPQVVSAQSQATIEQQQNNSYINPQQQMQNIPTVEQTKQEFIQNTQANSEVKKVEKKEGTNITFIIILFVIIFAAIFFLFPYLIKILG